MYKQAFKKIIDTILSFCGIVVLAIPMAVIALAIVVDDPGPVFFKQKRVGEKKNGELTYFNLIKFRSMKMSTPHDMPTHMLDNPEQYITRVGKILRKTSLDELPQIYQIFTQKMSIIGPRPALWNQYDLIAERERYGANDVKPGLTGWAQINGRDELEIAEKARLDGIYVKNLSFPFDCKCFFGTIVSVLKHDGVVEGGTGELKKLEKVPVAAAAAQAGQYSSSQIVQKEAQNINREPGTTQSTASAKPKTIMVVSSHTPSLFWFRMNMMKEFVAKGYQVIALGQEPESEWKEKFAANGILYKRLYVERNGLNVLHDLKTLSELNTILKEEKPEKIFCYQAKTIIYTCLAAKKNHIAEVYPLVAGLGSVFRGKGFKNKLVKTMMKTEYKIALKNSQSVMFQNEDDLSTFVNEGIVPREKCKIINGSGVDTKAFVVTPHPETPTFLMIARLIKDKGIMEYLEACRKIKAQNPMVNCLLVGPYDTNPTALKPEELEKYTEDGTITYFGEQSDVRPFIERASTFVLPSYHEGTPKTVLESMACGRAIITTDAPGCRETVQDGVNGYIVPVQNVDAIVEKMQIFIDHPQLAVEMGDYGRKIAEEKYDVKKVNASIMEIMKIKTL